MNFTNVDRNVRFAFFALALTLITRFLVLHSLGLDMLGTAGSIAKFTSASVIGNSAMTDDGSAVTLTGENLTLTSGNLVLSNGGFDAKTNGAVEGNLILGPITTKQTVSSAAPTSVSNGTLSADASNFMGRVSGIFDSTVTLTFSGGGFGTTAHCFAQVDTGTPGPQFITVAQSATAPVFSCFTNSTMPNQCANFEYQCWGH